MVFMFKKFSKFFLFLSDDILPIMPSLTAHTAIILISLYQLLIYLSLISAITSLSLYQHFIFISANTSFSILGVRIADIIKPKRNFTWSTSILDSTGSTLHFTEPTLHTTGSILHITVRVSIWFKGQTRSLSQQK